MLNADVKSAITTPSTTVLYEITYKTEDNTLNKTNVSYIKVKDPTAPKAKLQDAYPEAVAITKVATGLFAVGGNIEWRTNLLEAADAAAARKAEGKVYKSTKDWVPGFGPVKTGAYYPCSDGSDSPIEVTSQVGILLADKDDPERLTLNCYAIEGLRDQAKAAGIDIPETTYSPVNPWDEKYAQFRSYAEKKQRDPITPMNILVENIVSLKVVGTRNPDGSITWAK